MSQAPVLHVLLIAEAVEEIETLHAAIMRIPRVVKCTMQTTLTAAMEFIDGLTQSPIQAPHLILMCLDARRLVLMSLVVEAKRNPRLRWIPTVVLLDGNSLHDINALYDMNVNCVLPKNKVLVADGELLQNTCQFWLESTLLPQQSAKTYPL